MVRDRLPSRLHAVLDSVVVESMPLLPPAPFLGNSLLGWAVPHWDSGTPSPSEAPPTSAAFWSKWEAAPPRSSALVYARDSWMYGGLLSQLFSISFCSRLPHPRPVTARLPGAWLQSCSERPHPPTPSLCLPLSGTLSSPPRPHSSSPLPLGHSCWRINLGCGC